VSILKRVVSPLGKDASHTIRIQWSLGNSCNFSCEYCPSELHNGSYPWRPIQEYIDAVDKFLPVFAEHKDHITIEFIGGEVTVMPGILELLSHIKTNYNNVTTFMFTNGSRTVRWWNEAKHLIDEIVYSYHIDSLDYNHMIEVVEEIKDSIYCSFHLAGVEGKVHECDRISYLIRDCFKQGSTQDYWNVNINVKTMLVKELNNRNARMGQNFYDYTSDELFIMQKQSWLENPDAPPPDPNAPPPPKPHPSDWLITFEYDDKTLYYELDQIVNDKLNTFKGMKCSIGMEKFNIDMKGDVKSSWCGAKDYGNVYNDTFEMPEPSGTVCPFDYCNNLSDIQISKTA